MSGGCARVAFRVPWILPPEKKIAPNCKMPMQGSAAAGSIYFLDANFPPKVSTMAVPFPPEDLLDAIQVLKDKEASAYRVLDYLYGPPHDDRISVDVTAAPSAAASASSADFSLAYSVGTRSSASTATNSSETTGSVNETWRTKICEWSYQVIDHFDYDREIVAVSMHYLDRYLGKRTVDKRTFQLVAMTTLNLATKLYSPRHQQFSVHMLRNLSRGYFDEEHITAMEQSILSTLEWYVHPPTPSTFAKHLVLLLDPNACSNPQAWHDMMDAAKFLTELAVIDYHFAPPKPSSVGLAALLTAMEGVSEEHLPMKAKEQFACNVCRLAHIDPTDDEVMDCRVRFRDMYCQNDPFGEAGAASVITTPSRPTPNKTKVERIKAESPTGVDEVNFASVSLSSSSNELASFDEKGTNKNDDAAKETVAASASPTKSALIDTANATLKTTTASTSDKSKPSARTKISPRSSIASNVKKLRKAIRSSQQVEDAKKRRMG